MSSSTSSFGWPLENGEQYQRFSLIVRLTHLLGAVYPTKGNLIREAKERAVVDAVLYLAVVRISAGACSISRSRTVLS